MMIAAGAPAGKVPLRHPPASADRMTPYLEYMPHSESSLRHATLEALPFRLGRGSAAHLVIPSGQISRAHAEIYRTPEQVRVRDLQSTNGTFLNGRRIHDALLTHGDILHLAHQEFRFLLQDDEEPRCDAEGTAQVRGEVPLSVLCNLPLLKDLIRQRLVRTFFQPIVALDSQGTVGYEALGRGTHGKLSARPNDLFCLAERCQLVGELSRVFRTVAAADARNLPVRTTLFLNMHPVELGDPLLLESLRRIRADLGAGQPLVLEIHEETVTDLTFLRELREQLRDLNIGLAYDDFGAGQSRLGELAEVPPDYVKLNMTLIRDLHLAPARQSLVRAIIRVAKDLNVRVLAEGIEIEEEAEICRELGCAFGQGFLLGHPQAAPTTPDETTGRVELDSPCAGRTEGPLSGPENPQRSFDRKRIAS